MGLKMEKSVSGSTLETVGLSELSASHTRTVIKGRHRKKSPLSFFNKYKTQSSI